ncbi:hypothetical protein ACFQ48_07870 [Hymenobacter caeli]|uniref:Uncharacterized protein n=1 Tax=Hymenobacter caeli TaxID=2735894 RepID=A0ABX2FNV4_9BACT|nr:hypothetical protein [Hymenobacter caeli]NRT18159.1 hypothetical protein [Hymenobacter caeli]
MKWFLKAAAVAVAAFFVSGVAARMPGAFLPLRARRPPQAHLARKFLRQALIRPPGATRAALAPGAVLSAPQVVAQVAALRAQARRWGLAIELYKLGWRLPEGQPALLFYQFRFAADSAGPGPHVLLDVTFRDSLATRPLGFGVVVRRPR